MRSCSPAPLAITLLVGLAGAVEARPKLSQLDDIVQRSTTIVIARFAPPSDPGRATAYELVVERSLRGSVPHGLLRVLPSLDGHADFTKETRLVAFIDGTNHWIAYGVAAAGPSLEDGVLRLSGFNDENAHLVTPGVVTLAPLEARIVRDTPLSWTFRGPVL